MRDLHHHRSRGLRLALAIAASPFVIFLTAAVLLYLPPIQRWAVDCACQWAERETGYRVNIGSVHLAFPLDLALTDIDACDAEGQHLLSCQSALASIPIRPLFDGKVDVNGVILRDADINTRSIISDTHVEGQIRWASVSSHGYLWNDNTLQRLRADLRGADLDIVLTDTAAPDTTPSSPWIINLSRASISDSRCHLTLPGDSTRFFIDIDRALAHAGNFNTGTQVYTLSDLHLKTRALRYANYQMPMAELLLDSLAYADDRVTASARLATGRSSVLAGITLPLSALTTAATTATMPETEKMELWADGRLHTADIKSLADGIVPQEYLRLLPAEYLDLHTRVSGTLDHINVMSFRADMPSLLRAEASGRVSHVTTDARSAHLQVSLTTDADLNNVVHHLAGKSLNIPSGSRMKGTVSVSQTSATANLNLASAGGQAHIKGQTNFRSERYALSAALRHLPIGAFLQGISISPTTGTLTASGQGYNPTSRYAKAYAKGHIVNCKYDKYPLDNTRFTATLDNGQASALVGIHNSLLHADGTLSALMADSLDATVNLCVEDFRPAIVGLMKDSLCIGATFAATLKASHDFSSIASDGSIADISFISADTLVQARDLFYAFGLTPHSTMANLRSGDLNLNLLAHEPLDSILSKTQSFADLFMSQIHTRAIDQAQLANILPDLHLSLSAHSGNPLTKLMQMQGYNLSAFECQLATEGGLNGWLRAGDISIGRLRIDTIYSDIMQDSTGVKLLSRIDNYRKDNPNRFTATIDAYVLASGAGADLVFRDEHGDTGIDLGLQADVQDDGLRIHFYPRTPIIAYRRFTVNEDNYLTIGRDSTLRANIDLLADDGTGLKLYGTPTPEGHNDLTLSVNRLNIGELSSVLLWLPPMKGYLSGDFHVTDEDNVLSAMASLETQDFVYEDVEIGHLGTEILYLPKADGEHYAEGYLSYDGREVLQARGSYFSRGEGSFVGDVHLDDLPLSLADAFLAGTGVTLSGSTQGDFHAEGPLSAPVMNGALQFDQAHIRSIPYGVNFTLDSTPVEIKNSHIRFSDFRLLSGGNSPLVINGDVDAKDLTHIGVDLSMNTRNFELVNTPRTKESLLFGTIYTDFSGTLRGVLPALTVRGQLHLLDKTNATYILRDTPISVDDEFADLVTFTNLRDTTIVATEPTSTTSIDLRLAISIADAARFHCLLAEDGHSYVDVMGGGHLNFTYGSQGKMQLTGRLTLQNGEMKYELPVIPLKTFTIAPNSYVEFTGNPMNPTLSITATESTKASVSEGDQRRTVHFIVGVDITQTLDDMGLQFTIEAPEDLGLQNELAAMTPLQRNKTAVALLATGLYITDDLTSISSGFKGSNALNLFLQKSIQSIAAGALNTIDFSFDIGDTTTGSGSTTDYNFQFAKRFWGDRISVIIGGRVSSGAEANNTAASIINNISVEYRLDKGASRYVHLFYDRSAHDPMEGTLMKTGAGLVLRRKTNRLGELFLFRTPKQ